MRGCLHHSALTDELSLITSLLRRNSLSSLHKNNSIYNVTRAIGYSLFMLLLYRCHHMTAGSLTDSKSCNKNNNE